MNTLSLLVLVVLVAAANAQSVYYAHLPNPNLLTVCLVGSTSMTCKFSSTSQINSVSIATQSIYTRTSIGSRAYEASNVPISTNDRNSLQSGTLSITVTRADGTYTLQLKQTSYAGYMEGSDSALVAQDNSSRLVMVYTPGTFVYLKVRASPGCQGSFQQICTSYPCLLTLVSDYYIDISTSSSSSASSVAGGVLFSSRTSFPYSPCSGGGNSDSSSWWTTGNIVWVTIVCTVLFIILVFTISFISGYAKRRRMRGLPFWCCGSSSFSWPSFSRRTYATTTYSPPAPVQPAYIPPAQPAYTPAPVQPTYTPPPQTYYTPPVQQPPTYAPTVPLPPTTQQMSFGADNVMLDPVTGLFVVQPSRMEQAPQFDPVTGEFRMM